MGQPKRKPNFEIPAELPVQKQRVLVQARIPADQLQVLKQHGVKVPELIRMCIASACDALRGGSKD